MNFERLNNWAMLVANAGVALGIFLLAYEIGQNRKAVEAEIYQARSQAAQQLNLAIMDSDHLPPLLVAIGTSFNKPDLGTLNKLNPEDKLRASYLANSLRHVMDNNVYQYEQGFLEETYYREVVLPNLRQMAPMWEEFGLLGDVRHEFSAAIAESRAMDEDPQ